MSRALALVPAADLPKTSRALDGLLADLRAVNQRLEGREVISGEIIEPGRGGAWAVVSPSAFRRETRTLHLPPGCSLAEAVELSGARPRLWTHLGIYIEDIKVPREAWARVRPKPGVAVYIRVEMAGGGGGKNPLRAILMLAVTVAASIFAGPLGGAIASFLPGSAALWGGVAFFALQTAGSFLVNALIPPPKAKGQSYAFDQQPGNPYAQLTGVRNSFPQLGDPIPRVLGQRRIYPMLAARPYTENQGNTQYLRMLLLAGYGPLDISDIRIGNTAITAFPGAQVEIREGWSTDPPPSLFTRSIEEEGLSVLLNPSSANTRTTETATTEVSLDINFPSGLFHVENDGSRTNRTVVFTVEYRANGSGGAWTNADWIDGSATYGTGTDGRINATDSTANTVVRSGRFAVPSAGQWDIRVTRTTAAGGASDFDTAYWTVLRSIKQDSPVNMSGLCLISLRLQATAQLNGAPDTINCLAKSYLPVWDDGDEEWNYTLSRSAAWAYVDVLRRRGTEIRLADSRVNLDAMIDWAADDLANERYCDLVIEGGSVYTAAEAVAATARAQPTALVDGRYSIVRDVEQTVPRQHISPRNSSGYRGFKAFFDVPHALRCTFINPDKNYAQDVVIVYQDDYNEDGSAGKTAASIFETLDFPGCTSSDQAWKDGRYHLAVMLLRPEEHSVTMDFEALRVTKGDLVRFSHDVISIGLGHGRLVARILEGENIVALRLDSSVIMEEGESYALRVRLSDGSSVLMSLITQAGEHYEVELAAPVLAATGPAPGDMFMFGKTALESAPMLIKSITPGQDMSARVTMIDAQAGVWTADSGEIPAFNSYITRGVPVAQLEPDPPVITLRSDENVIQRLADGTLISRVQVSISPFAVGDVPPVMWEAEHKRNGSDGDWAQIGRASLTTSNLYISPAVDGEIHDVRARVFSAGGMPSEWTTVSNHTVVGKTTAPSPPSSLVVSETIDGVVLTATASPSIDVVGYVVKYGGANWAAATDIGTFAAFPMLIAFTLAGATVFRVKAIDAVGLLSTEVTVTSGASNAPIDGAQIDDASIPAGKLAVSELSAITATIGLLRTATSGARTEIEDDLIRVYDEDDNLRVEIGVFS